MLLPLPVQINEEAEQVVTQFDHGLLHVGLELTTVVNLSGIQHAHVSHRNLHVPAGIGKYTQEPHCTIEYYMSSVFLPTVQCDVEKIVTVYVILNSCINTCSVSLHSFRSSTPQNIEQLPKFHKIMNINGLLVIFIRKVHSEFVVERV